MKRIHIAALWVAVLLFSYGVQAFSQVPSKWDGPGQRFLQTYSEWREAASRKSSDEAAVQALLFRLEEEFGMTRYGARASRPRPSKNAKESQISDYISVIISHKDPNALAQAEAIGFLPQTRLDKICTGLLPVDKAAEIEALPGITHIHLGIKNRLYNNESRKLNRVPQIQELYADNGFDSAYTGKGVVVGIVDVGFDFTHVTFFDDPADTATYRVKRVWDQRDNSEHSAPPAGYNYGREYATTPAILSEMHDIISVSGEHHGTHVAGTAIGSGHGTAYKGMAPGADVVLVSTTMTDAAIIDGVRYVMNYAAQEGKPCVVNLSFGIDIGPHDGTAKQDSALNQLSGPGRLVVVSAGNSGADTIHVQGNLDGTNPIMIGLVPEPEKNSVKFDIYDLENGLEVAVCLVDTASGGIYENKEILSYGPLSQVVYSMANVFFTKNQELRYEGVPVANVFTSFLTHGGRYSNYNMEISGFAGKIPDGCVLAVSLNSQVSGTPTSFHAWCTGMQFSSYGKTFLRGGDCNYTHNANFATADSVISVGAYMSRYAWTAMDGQGYHYENAGILNDICTFSGRGPRIDGVMKPDICAPGSAIISAGNSFVAVDNGEKVAVTESGAKAYPWMVMQGTSMSSPAVSGIIALLLQHEPRLKPSQIKEILSKSAKRDEYVAASGSDFWGAGKVDALQAMHYLKDSVTIHIDTTSEIKDTSRVLPKYRFNLPSYIEHGSIIALYQGDTIRQGRTVTLDSGSVLELQAVPDSGYEVKYWWDGVRNTAKRTITLKSDMVGVIYCTFELAPVKYTVTVRQSMGGKVYAYLDGVEIQSGEQIADGTVINLKAVPNSGYKLESWWDGNTELERSYTVNSAVIVKANFVEATVEPDPDPDTVRFTVTITQSEGGTVLVFLKTTPVESGQQIDSGQVLQLVADAWPGYEFVEWFNGETVPQFEYVLKKDEEISAHFALRTENEDRPEGDAPKLCAYPNPSRGIFHVQTHTPLKAALYTEAGYLIKAFDWKQAGVYPVNLENNPSGVYILYYSGQGRKGSLRLVRQ